MKATEHAGSKFVCLLKFFNHFLNTERENPTVFGSSRIRLLACACGWKMDMTAYNLYHHAGSSRLMGFTNNQNKSYSSLGNKSECQTCNQKLKQGKVSEVEE